MPKKDEVATRAPAHVPRSGSAQRWMNCIELMAPRKNTVGTLVNLLWSFMVKPRGCYFHKYQKKIETISELREVEDVVVEGIWGWVYSIVKLSNHQNLCGIPLRWLVNGGFDNDILMTQAPSKQPLPVDCETWSSLFHAGVEHVSWFEHFRLQFAEAT